MYQPLIWLGYVRDEPRSLRAPGDSERLERLADALIDSVRRDAQFHRDLLGGKMVGNETQTVQLAVGQFRHAIRGMRLNVHGTVAP